MFLYRFVRRRRRRRRVRRRRRPQILVHAITFEQLLRFLSFLAQLLALAYRLTDYILVHFRRDLDLEFSRSNMELAISQPKMVRLPRNKKQTHRLNSRLQMWPLGLTLAMTLTLNFQGQILNWLYLSQKWSNCQETKSKHIDWTLGFKCDHWVWPWPWPWPWIFKVKYRIGFISAINGVIATKRKAYISIDLKTSNVTIWFDLGHDLDLGFSRSNMELAISLWKMVRLPRNKKQTHQLNSTPQMWPSDLTLAMTLTLNFQGQIWNLLHFNQKWSDCHKMKSKHINLNSRPQIW